MQQDCGERQRGECWVNEESKDTRVPLSGRAPGSWKATQGKAVPEMVARVERVVISKEN